MKKEPTFFIIGAARSGTTSLWMHLKQHPEIVMPESINDKEPSYFCDICGYKSYDDYLKLFKNSNNCKAIGEASTSYLTYPKSAYLIQNQIPNAKIMVILRNPTERAFSLYRWMVSNGFEKIYPFEKALKFEKKRKDSNYFFVNNPQYFYNYLYFNSGLYAKQLSLYYKFFKKNRIKIILLNDIKNNPQETIESIYKFIDVSIIDYRPIEIKNKSNTKPLFIKIHYFLRSLYSTNNSKSCRKISYYLFRKNLSLCNIHWQTIKYNTMNQLTLKYRDDISRLEELINKDLSSWKTISTRN